MIDAHQHFWKFDSVRDAWITDDMRVIRRNFLPPDLYPLLQGNNINGCVAVQADQSQAENDFLLSLANEFDFVKGVVGWIDLRSPDIEEKLQECSSLGKLKGFRHIVQGEPKGFLLNEDFIRGVNTLGKYGFTYDLLIYHHQLEEALQFLAEIRETKIVVDHLAKPSIKTGEKTHWELNMAAVATFRNVSCKISGMVTEADWSNWKQEDFFPYLDELFETFGPDRLMYGSDWPVCLVAASYAEQLSILSTYLEPFSPAEKRKVMGDNAIQFYDL